MRGKKEDLTGQLFGYALVVERGPSDKHRNTRWWIECQYPKADGTKCGNRRLVYALALKSKKEPTISCGCWIKANYGKANITHGCSHNNRTVNYYTWIGAIGRCFNKDDKRYKDWGGRGITMCEGYRHNFPAFDRDLGPRPEGKMIDRKNNEGHYSCGKCHQCEKFGWPMNLHWVTPKESADNRRPPRRG